MPQPLAFQAHLALLRQRGWEVVSELEDPPYARLRRRDPATPARSHHCELWLDESHRVRVSAPGTSPTQPLSWRLPLR